MPITLYQLRPDVAGSLGPKTTWAPPSPSHPHGSSAVIRAHYVLDHWYGDSLIAAHPVFAVTEQIGAILKAENITGFSLESMDISTSELYKHSNSIAEIPTFVRLIPRGTIKTEPRRPKVLSWNGEDICFGFDLIVTERVLSLFNRQGIPKCNIRPLVLDAR